MRFILISIVVGGFFLSCLDQTDCSMARSLHEPPVVTCGRYERVLIRKFSPHYSLSLTKMLPKSRDIEERVAKASIAMNEDSRLKGIKAASQFGAPYNRLMACRRGRPASCTRGGTNKSSLNPKTKLLKSIFLCFNTLAIVSI
jgi:hypothetical protein